MDEKRVVGARAQALIQQHDVSRGPADVQPRDDAQDFQRRGVRLASFGQRAIRSMGARRRQRAMAAVGKARKRRDQATSMNICQIKSVR